MIKLRIQKKSDQATATIQIIYKKDSGFELMLVRSDVVNLSVNVSKECTCQFFEKTDDKGIFYLDALINLHLVIKY